MNRCAGSCCLAVMLGLTAGRAALADDPILIPPGLNLEESSQQDVADAPGTELVVQVSLGKFMLSDAMVVYENAYGLLLPLDALSHALDFAILVEPQAGRALGWFLNESRTVELDVTKGEARIEGVAQTWQPGAVAALDDDIYVATALLEQWFPLKFEVDTGASEVKVTSRERLPFEDALAREQLRGRGDRNVERIDLPKVEPAYKLIDWPFADISLDVGTGEASETANQQRSSALITGDLLYMGASGFLAVEDGTKISDARFRLERRDEDGQAIGNLGLTGVALGDVFTSSLPLVASGATATGVSLTNQPIARLSELDQVTLRGEVTPGWDVELYRNGALYDFGRATADGRYEFAKVPLLVGPNDLTVVLLGPQGQRREIPQRFFAGPGLIKKGQTFFEAFAGRHEERLIETQDEFQDEAKGSDRMLFSLEQGIATGLSAAAGFARVPAGSEVHEYASLGLRGQFRGVFGRLDYAQDVDRGSAVEASAATRWGDRNLSLSHAQFYDFESEESLNTGAGALSRTEVRLDAPLNLGRLPRISSGLELEYNRLEAGREQVEVSSRLSTYIFPVALAHTLDAQVDDGEFTSGQGSLLLSARVGAKDQVRGELGYGVKPDTDLDSVLIGWNRNLANRSQIRTELAKTFGDDEDSFLSVGFTRSWKTLTGGLSAGFGEEDGFAVGLNLFFSLGRSRSDGSLLMRSESMASNGVIDARAFLDMDANSLYSPQDLPVENVAFDGGSDKWRTDKRGRTTLPGFGAYQSSDLSVDTASLEDPYWVPATPGYRVVTRPGQATVLEFPVTPTGEVEGTVYLKQSGETRPASNVRLLLVTATGRVVAETRSSYDGYYLIERVPPGRYRLNVDPDQVHRQRLTVAALPELRVRAGSDNSVRGFDVMLERSASAAQEKAP